MNQMSMPAWKSPSSSSRITSRETHPTEEAVHMIDETFDCFELPGVPGGFRGALTDGIAKYLGIRFASYSGGGRQAVMEMYPEAYCRLVKAVAEEARRMMAEGVPPFDDGSDRRGEPDDGPIEIRLYAKTGRYTKTMIRRVSLDHAEEIFKAVRTRKPRA